MPKLVVANWKMNGDLKLIKAYADFFNNVDIKSDFVVCPPAPYIWSAIGAGFDVGGQDCHHKETGAYTGDVSASMLRTLGCKYVLVGHSERRAHHNETDTQVRSKAENALKNSITPIICVGETIEHRDFEETYQIIEAQLAHSLPKLDDGYVVAYEPIWAIGTGKTATPSDITKMHDFIRTKVGDKIKIIYGGSVSPDNAYSILHLENVDGVLVGGASLDVIKMHEILKCDLSDTH